MRTLSADLSQLRPRPVCRRRPSERRPGWNRDRIHNGFCHKTAIIFEGVIRHRTPWFELRRLLDDQVPATGAQRTRGIRDDLLLSIILVVAALLARMDLKSRRVGFRPGGPRKHDFVGLTVERIAIWTGLDDRTVSRVLQLLRRAGLVHGPGRDGVHVIDQPRDRLADGSYDPHPAVRQFTELFFAGLGLADELHGLNAPPIRPDPGVCAEQETARRAELAREKRLAARERPPDG